MLGNELKQVRLNLGLSQAGLSELTNISQARLSGFELGKLVLSDLELTELKITLSNTELINNRITRKKRYTKIEQNNINSILKSRRGYKRTNKNEEYLNSLNELWSMHLSQNKQATCISLFAGCGGFSLGASAAGFKVVGHIEIEDSARDIYKKNFQDSECLGTDIQKVDIQVLESKFNGINIDGIIGGPPCQGFSLSGKRDARDPRNRLFVDYLNILSVIKPKFAVLENVEKLLSMKNSMEGFVRDDILSEFKKKGYIVSYFKVNAADYGVPQNRKRVLFVAIREDLNIHPSLPSVEFEDPDTIDLFSAGKSPYTLGDAVSDLPFIESGEQSDIALHKAVNHPEHVIRWLWDVEQGRSAHDNKDENLRPPSGFNTTYKRQVWNSPAATVQTTSGMISGCNNVHPVATRSLSIREVARLQSFPDDFSFAGKDGAIRTAIGNAVPPILAFKILNYLKGQIL